MPASVFGSPPILEWYRTQCKIARFWRIQWEEVQPTVLQSQSEIGRKTIVLESQWHSGLESMNLGHKLSHFRSNFIYTSFMFCGISLSLSFSFSSPPPPPPCVWVDSSEMDVIRVYQASEPDDCNMWHVVSEASGLTVCTATCSRWTPSATSWSVSPASTSCGGESWSSICPVALVEILPECVIFIYMYCSSWRDPAWVRHLYLHVL